jgi:hypothetical protein
VSKKLLAAAVAAAFVVPSAFAQEPRYNYLEFDYRNVDRNEDGFGLRASMVFLPQLHLFGNAHRVTDGPLRRDQGTLALGWHVGIMPITDLTFRGGWTRARDRIGEDNGFFDVNGDEVTIRRDDGFVAQAGIRSMITDALELHGYVQHEDLFGGNNAAALGAIFNFTPQFGVSALAEVGEQDTIYELGLRFTFAGRPGFPQR